jgi:hypothetical protein
MNQSVCTKVSNFYYLTHNSCTDVPAKRLYITIRERHLPVLARQLTPSAMEGTPKTLAFIAVVIGVSLNIKMNKKG